MAWHIASCSRLVDQRNNVSVVMPILLMHLRLVMYDATLQYRDHEAGILLPAEYFDTSLPSPLTAYSSMKSST